MILRFGYLARSAFFIVTMWDYSVVARSSLMELAKSMTMGED
jgi:hypothetical protein